MKSLKSNGMLSDGEWMGVDTELSYPAVDTCITVTCLVGDKLAGCHLFHHWKPLDSKSHHDKCVTEFANEVKKLGAVKAMYIIGNVDHWKNHITNVIKQFKTELGYIGVVGGSDPATCRGDIGVKLELPVSLKFTKDGDDVKLKLLET